MFKLFIECTKCHKTLFKGRASSHLTEITCQCGNVMQPILRPVKRRQMQPIQQMKRKQRIEFQKKKEYERYGGNYE